MEEEDEKRLEEEYKKLLLKHCDTLKDSLDSQERAGAVRLIVPPEWHGGRCHHPYQYTRH